MSEKSAHFVLPAQGGIGVLGEYIRSKLGEINSATVNVAILGSPGSGKSTLINALKPEDDKGTLKFWEISTVGCSTDRFNFEIYDFFLILSRDSFSELDCWFASEILAREKKFFFVKTNVNDAVQGHPDKKEDHALQEIRLALKANVAQFLEKIDEKIRIFLIDCKFQNKFDFQGLKKYLTTDLVFVNRKALLTSLTDAGRSFIEKNVSRLRRRVKFTALASSACAGLPVPLVSTGVDLGLIWNELRVYENQLGLDEASLKRFAASTNGSFDRLKKTVEDDWFDTFGISFAAGITKEAFVKKPAEKIAFIVSDIFIAGEFAKTYLPFVGNFAAAGLSFFVTGYVLRDFLNGMEKMALNVLETCMRQEGEKMLVSS